jgi:hypothetical protein
VRERASEREEGGGGVLFSPHPFLSLARSQAPAKGKQLKGTLSTVIGSLDKLVELEKRISSLESDNLHDRVKDGASVPQQKVGGATCSFA